MELSLCLAVWNTSHLLKRSVYTYLAQTLPPNLWELIVIDDNSPDDVRAALKPLEGKINLTYQRLEHPYGMRGNTVSFNTAFALAKGRVLAETTPECMLPPDALMQMLAPHTATNRAFVALKTYNLQPEAQVLLDTVAWQHDLTNITTLPSWDSPMTQHNVKVAHFGTHQVCSIRKTVWDEITNGKGFPLFCDWGTDDPWYAGRRNEHKIQDITLPNSCMAIHQWHPPFAYWIAKGYGPRLNRWAHTMANYMHDTSGHVPEGGTCTIWDKGSHDPVGEDERLTWQAWDETVRITRGETV